MALDDKKNKTTPHGLRGLWGPFYMGHITRETLVLGLLMAKSKNQKRRKQRMCRGKRKYESQDDATKGLTDMRLHTGNTEAMTVYKCNGGAHWHFGHPPGFSVAQYVMENEEK